MKLKALDIISSKDCCGCEACANICPKMCITMKSNNEGFMYPIVDEDICIHCELCKKVCPALNTNQKYTTTPKKVYAAKNPNEVIRMQSSSGGLFYMLSEKIIKKGGVVFGVRFDNDFNTIHDYTETIDGLEKFRGSKYVQSKIGNCYITAKAFLDQGRDVLFSGTPCQIAGLRSYLRKEYLNLHCIEVVCHGVPSPLVFKHYIKTLEDKYNDCITQFKFRDKTNGWKAYEVVADFANGMQYRSAGHCDPFIRGFIYNLYIRRACTNCKFKGFTSGADITLGDFWGSERFGQKYNDNKGISLVCINTSRGLDLFRSIKSDITGLIESTLNDAVEYNPCLVSSIKKHSKESKFYRLYTKKDFDILVNELLYVSKFKNLLTKTTPYYIGIILRKIKHIIYRK